MTLDTVCSYLLPSLLIGYFQLGDEEFKVAKIVLMLYTKTSQWIIGHVLQQRNGEKSTEL